MKDDSRVGPGSTRRRLVAAGTAGATLLPLGAGAGTSATTPSLEPGQAPSTDRVSQPAHAASSRSDDFYEAISSGTPLVVTRISIAPASQPKVAAAPSKPAPPPTSKPTVIARPKPEARLPKLSRAPNARLTMKDLGPWFEHFGKKHDVSPKILAGVTYQESSFRNWRVHRDGTGHGLHGLDDNGMLPYFERWLSKKLDKPYKAGRGKNARIIPPEYQIEYLAMTLASYQRERKGEGIWGAVRAWHRGPTNRNDGLGELYERLVKQRIRELF